MKKRHLNGIFGSLCCIFCTSYRIYTTYQALCAFCRTFHAFLLAFSHLLPSSLHPLPSLRAFLLSFHTFYRASTPFAELSRSLLNLHVYRIFLVCTALHVYPCISHHVLCFLCALFVPFFCVICILLHAICTFNRAICTFNYAICTFSHTICAIFRTTSTFYSVFYLSVLLFYLFAHTSIPTKPVARTRLF